MAIGRGTFKYPAQNKGIVRLNIITRPQARCSAPSAIPYAVDIRFNIPYRVQFGQSLSLVGSSNTLGDWNVDRRVPMQWSDGDVWCAEVHASGREPALEYKYVVVEKDGQVSSWKPGGNLTIELGSSEGAVSVRDHWDGDVHEVSVDVSATSTAQEVSEARSRSRIPPERDVSSDKDEAVVEALNRAYNDLETTIQTSLQLADDTSDPADPRLLVNDRKLASATRRAISLSKALESGGPPPAYILKEFEREDNLDT